MTLSTETFASRMDAYEAAEMAGFTLDAVRVAREPSGEWQWHLREVEAFAVELADVVAELEGGGMERVLSEGEIPEGWREVDTSVPAEDAAAVERMTALAQAWEASEPVSACTALVVIPAPLHATIEDGEVVQWQPRERFHAAEPVIPAGLRRALAGLDRAMGVESDDTSSEGAGRGSVGDGDCADSLGAARRAYGDSGDSDHGDVSVAHDVPSRAVARRRYGPEFDWSTWLDSDIPASNRAILTRKHDIERLAREGDLEGLERLRDGLKCVNTYYRHLRSCVMWHMVKLIVGVAR